MYRTLEYELESNHPDHSDKVLKYSLQDNKNIHLYDTYLSEIFMLNICFLFFLHICSFMNFMGLKCNIEILHVIIVK